MRLTASGHVLSAVLKEGFQTIAQGIRTVKANREARPLQIILRLAFDENWLMTRLGSFWAEHPAIALSLNPSMKSVDLVAEDMDLAMRFGKGVWPGLHAKKAGGRKVLHYRSASFDADITEVRLACVKRIQSTEHGYYLVRPRSEHSANPKIFINWLKRSL